MTKMLKGTKIVSLLMVLVIFASLFAINASAAVLTQNKSLTVKNPTSSMTVSAGSYDTLYDVYSSKASTSYSKLLKVKLGFSYTQNDKGSDNQAGRIFPITVSAAGTIKLDVSVLLFQKEFEIGLYTDSGCTNRIGSAYVDFNKNPYTKGIQVPSAGTYYLRVSNYVSSYNPPVFTNQIDLSISFFNSNNTTLKKNITHYIGTSSNTRYFKFTLTSTSNVLLSSNTTFTFSLCNSKKSVIYDYQSFSKTNSKKAAYRLAKGTYYIKTKSVYADNQYFTLKYTTSADPTLKANTYKTFYPGDSTATYYFKFKPTVSGYVSVTFRKADGYDNGGNVTLCNSSKTALSNKQYVTAGSTYSPKAVFGVSKNKTYYLKVTSLYGKASIKFAQASVSEKSGSSRKTAKSLSRSKTVTGTITAGSSRADYYKIKVTSAKILKLYTSGSATGSLDLQLYTANGKKYANKVTAIRDVNYKNSFKTYSKIPRGTYYIKIYRRDTKSNGYYTLKWS